MASLGLSIDEQKAVERFRQSVVEPSMDSLVVLDFWAEWCGPCKALTPMLEKVTAEYADKGVLLAKLNVDEEPFIASQFQIKSIPTVYAAMGEEVLASGDGQRAADIFSQIVEIAPDSAAAASGLIRALVLAGLLEEAQTVLDTLPAALATDAAVERARAALTLAKDAPEQGELATLRAAAEAEPADPDARFAYASAAFAAGDRDAAADTLLAMIAADRGWNEGAARTKLLQIFEVVGLEDPWVAARRRRLSTILFG